MSGPKKSSWEIQQEIKEKRKKEKAQKRAKQIDEINNKISSIDSQMSKLREKYPEITKNIEKIVDEWINEVEVNLNGDLRDCFRKVRGIENYIKNQKSTLKDKQKVLDAQKIIEEKKRIIVDSLESIKDEYQDILNDAIIQRVEIFKKSILANPDNINTQKQISNFKIQLFKMQEEHLDNRENTKYVADTFANILKSDIKVNGDTLEIQGNIDGVPIGVKLNYKNSNINLDTPVNGSCKKAINTIQQKLNNSNINLGEIKVINTGEILNKNTQNKSVQRLRQ